MNKLNLSNPVFVRISEVLKKPYKDTLSIKGFITSYPFLLEKLYTISFTCPCREKYTYAAIIESN